VPLCAARGTWPFGAVFAGAGNNGGNVDGGDDRDHGAGRASDGQRWDGGGGAGAGGGGGGGTLQGDNGTAALALQQISVVLGVYGPEIAAIGLDSHKAFHGEVVPDAILLVSFPQVI
jgi:hypothetical protein